MILSGRGSTTVWNDAGQRMTFEWKAGALFAYSDENPETRKQFAAELAKHGLTSKMDLAYASQRGFRASDGWYLSRWL